MEFVPAGVVLAMAVTLGYANQGVTDFAKVGTLLGSAAVIAMLALAALDYRTKLRRQGIRHVAGR